LQLSDTPIENLGNLKHVGGWLDLRGTPMAERYFEDEIRDMVQVGGLVYFGTDNL
jgi:hypothetical protein